MAIWQQPTTQWGFLVVGLLFLTHCTTPPTKPIKREVGYVEKGMASWYGPGFHGKPTASGERYDMHKMTAAHKTLPLGTVVQVQSLSTNRQVTVRINDRGPFIRGRIIDLSYGAAKDLKMIGKGTEPVQLTVLGFQQSAKSLGPFWIQVGSFHDRTQAAALHKRLAEDYTKVRLLSVELPTGTWYRVQVGEFSTEKRAHAVGKQLHNTLGVLPVVVPK